MPFPPPGNPPNPGMELESLTSPALAGRFFTTALESKNNALFLKIRECEHKEVGLYFSGFSRQEYQSGLPFPSPGELLNPGIEPRSPTL